MKGYKHMKSVLTLKENLGGFMGRHLSVLRDGKYTTIHIYFENLDEAKDDEKLIEEVFAIYNERR